MRTTLLPLLFVLAIGPALAERAKKVVGINALGGAPTGAAPEFFAARDLAYPPPYGPLAAVTPGTPGGLLVMLAEYGTLWGASGNHGEDYGIGW
jgi:gamma-glutamyltranspeptidase